MIEQDHVRRIQSQTRRRQTERRSFSANPSLHQGAAATALGLFRRHCYRERLGGDARGVHGDTPGLDLSRIVILVGTRDLPLQGLGQFRFLRADQFHHIVRCRRCRNHAVGGDRCAGDAAAHQELDALFAFHRIEPEMPRHEGLLRTAELFFREAKIGC